ncbi:MlaD family protein [Nocardia sp. NPDC003482]
MKPPSRMSLVVVAVAVVLATAATVRWQVGRAETRSLCADFDTTYGLYDDAAVTIRGITVGKVRALEPQGGHVRVRMTLDDRPLPANVGAAVVGSSILTDRRVELVDASYHGGPLLPADACIARDRTRVPVSASDALDSFAKLVHQVTAPDASGTPPLQRLLTGTDREMSGLGPTINQELRQLADALAQPDALLGHFGRLLDNGAELSEFVTAQWDDLKTTLVTFGPGLELIEHMLGVVKVVVEKLALAVGPLDRLFDQHFPYLMEALNSTIPVMTLVRTRTEESKDLLDRIPGVIAMLRTMIQAQPGAVALDYRAPEVSTADPAGTVPLPQLLVTLAGGAR